MCVNVLPQYIVILFLYYLLPALIKDKVSLYSYDNKSLLIIIIIIIYIYIYIYIYIFSLPPTIRSIRSHKRFINLTSSFLSTHTH